MIRPEERDAFRAAIKSQAHMRFIVHPNLAKPAPILRDQNLEDVINQCRFYTAGDRFPHIDHDPHVFRTGQEFLEGYNDGFRQKSMFRLYESGQFVHLATLEEDEPSVREELKKRLDIPDEATKDKLDGYLDFVWNVQRFAEYFGFSQRLSNLIAKDHTWRLEIGLIKPGVRALSVLDPRRSIWNLYHVDSDTILEVTASSKDLQAEPGPACVAMVIKFVRRFKLDADEQNIRGILESIGARR